MSPTQILGLIFMSGLFVIPLLIAISILFPRITIFWMKSRTKKKAIYFYISLFVLNIIALTATVFIHSAVDNSYIASTEERAAEERDSGSESLSLPYEVVSLNEASIPGRRRMMARIVSPEAREGTFEQRGETVMQAARQTQADTDADFVLVSLEPNERLLNLGYVLSIARYAPDGGGISGDENWTWQVESSHDSIDAQQIEIAEAWNEKRDDFQISDGLGGTMTDEDALAEEIASDFGISPDEVRLPLFWLETYTAPQ